MIETYGETDSTAKRVRPRFESLVQNLIGPHTFGLLALILASLAFSLGRLTVYAANESQFFVYVACAIFISQTFVVAALFIFGKIVFRTTWPRLGPPLAVTSILLVNVLGTIAFEEILRNWNLDPIPQTLFQRVISLLFTTFIYLCIGRVLLVLSRNLMQVDLAKGLLAELSKQQVELTQEIRDARTFSIREISLEIQSTLGTFASFTATNSVDQNLGGEIDTLQKILKAIEIQINEIRNRFPGSLRFPKVYSKVRYSPSSVISASAKLDDALPIVISVVAFFGFSSWLSYFMDELHAAFWGSTLSAISFVIFFGYEKYIASKFFAESVTIRIVAFEILVITYLFFWLLILGFFAGDDTASYGAALAYAAIPFIFFNGGAILSGVITASQEQREQFTRQAVALRKDLAELEKIRSQEDKVWKSLFAGDIALSPTMANVVLRDASTTGGHALGTSVIANVTATWKSVLVKLSSVT